MKESLAIAQTRLLHLEQETLHLKSENKNIQDERNQLLLEHARLEEQLEQQKIAITERLRYTKSSEELLKKEFESLSAQVIKSQQREFEINQRESLTSLLKPFETQIKEFRGRLEGVHQTNVENKASLETQIEQMMRLNGSLQSEAKNLSAALRGNKKLLGNWGEFQLESILELAGMQKGINYTTQTSFKNDAQDILRPDFIVKMPQNRQVIIDSKVSLKDYMDYIGAKDEETRKASLKKHVACIRQHIKGLGAKNYQDMLKENALDYVFIFFPIESAYIDAINADATLYDDAFKNNIALATASSLFPILRTIENLWRIEKQNRNVQEIAEVGGKLHDKLCGFVADMKNIDKSLLAARVNYDKAFGKLSDGRGNSLSLASRLVKLGAKSNKQLPGELMDSED